VLNVKQRKQRTFDDLASVDDVIELLKTEFRTRPLRVKYSLEGSEVQINEYLDDKSLMMITDPDFRPDDDTIVIYGLLDKYIEIDLQVVETRGPGYFHCRIRSVRKAKTGRRDLRFKSGPGEVVTTNFRVSKHTIDVSGLIVPTGIKVILDQFQTQNSKLSDIVKVGVFDTEDVVLKLIKKTGKTFYVEDAANPESYRAVTEDFIDLKEFLGDDFSRYIKKVVERGYKSIIACPLIYITESEQSFPFAYIQLISKSENFSMDKLLDVKGMTFKLVERIRDANTLTIPVHQQVVDISRGGAKIMITDDNLKKYLIRARGFIFDIVFKLQAPITIYGEIRYTNVDDDGNMFIGVDFAGNSSRKGEMKRFYSIIKPMELEYKSRLLKDLKKRKKADGEA